MAQTYVALESQVGKRFGKSESESESKAFNNLLQCFPNCSNGFVTYTPSYPDNQTNLEHDSATTQSPSSPSSRMGSARLVPTSTGPRRHTFPWFPWNSRSQHYCSRSIPKPGFAGQTLLFHPLHVLIQSHLLFQIPPLRAEPGSLPAAGGF